MQLRTLNNSQKHGKSRGITWPGRVRPNQDRLAEPTERQGGKIAGKKPCRMIRRQFDFFDFWTVLFLITSSQ
jgi:hypothetical protein